MVAISELKQGDKIYDVVKHNIIRYTYLCIHPTGRGEYHILIDSYEEPGRMHKKRLQAILDKNILSNNEARLYAIKELKELITHYESEEVINLLKD